MQNVKFLKYNEIKSNTTDLQLGKLGQGKKVNLSVTNKHNFLAEKTYNRKLYLEFPYDVAEVPEDGIE